MNAAERTRIRHWLLNHQQELYERAVKEIDSTASLYDAVRPVQRGQNLADGDISRTQLTALLNMGRTLEAKPIFEYIRLRVERRRKMDKEGEARFWESLLKSLKSMNTFVDRCLSDCRFSDPDRSSKSEVETILCSAYIEHFVAHCRFRIHYELEEIGS